MPNRFKQGCSGSTVPLVTVAVLGLTFVNPVERWSAIFSSPGGARYSPKNNKPSLGDRNASLAARVEW